MLMVTARLDPFLTPVVGAYGRNLSFKQFANGSVLIGGGFRGTADPDRNLARVDVRGLAASARTAAAIFPIIRGASIVRSWAGIEGFTPDGIPVIGPSDMANAFHAFGFCGHGFQLGPIVGGIIADLVTTGQSALPIDAFRIDRFANR
jgi:sarcosine oxidase subunit beta